MTVLVFLKRDIRVFGWIVFSFVRVVALKISERLNNSLHSLLYEVFQRSDPLLNVALYTH